MSSAEVSIPLPEAPPGTYLRWTAFWREVEGVMIKCPSLAALAGREAAPFVYDPVANYIATRLIPHVVQCAAGAKRAGRSAVSPRIEGEERMISLIAQYLRRWVGWLGRPGVLEALDIEPLEPDIIELQALTLERIEGELRQLAPTVRRVG